jgi:hypothetical protein
VGWCKSIVLASDGFFVGPNPDHSTGAKPYAAPVSYSDLIDANRMSRIREMSSCRRFPPTRW